jgi:hypothetical protein
MQRFKVGVSAMSETTNPQFVFRLLLPIENTSFVGEGLTAATSDSAAGNGFRRGATAGWWTAPSLRTTGCLKEPEAAWLRSVYP